MKKIKENIILIYVIVIAVLIGILIAAMIAFYFSFQGSEVIAPGVSVKGVDISGMTKSQAKETVSNYLKENMADNLVFQYSNYQYNVEVEQIEAKFDVDSAINYAFDVGRVNSFFGNVHNYMASLVNKINIEPKLQYNEEALENYMDFLEVSLPDQVEQPSYYLDSRKSCYYNRKNWKWNS